MKCLWRERTAYNFWPLGSPWISDSTAVFLLIIIIIINNNNINFFGKAVSVLVLFPNI
jgi:hypothetical protein